MSKNGTFVFERSSFIPEIFKFLFKIDDVTNGCSKNINHKIKNIPGNI